MADILVPSSHVHPKDSGISQASYVTQKEQEWLDSVVPHAIVSPRAMLVHFVNAPPADTAVVNAFNFYAPAFQANIRLHIYILWVLLL